MVSYKDIRSETGLAISTISKYFNGQAVLEPNRVAIEAAAAKLNFRPNLVARSLRLRRAETVGVLLPALDSEFHLSVIAGAEPTLRANGRSVIVASSGSSEVEAVPLLLRQMVSGIITVPSAHDVAPLLVAAQQIPIVVIDREQPGLELDGVFLANRDAGAMAIRHLLDHGHRRVGVLGGDLSISTMALREAGAREELRHAGLDLREGYLEAVPLTINDGYRAMVRLLGRKPRPTAVFATNDNLTLGGLIALNESGLRLGREMSMIGFDGRAFAQATVPRLTVVAQPTHEIAATAVELILARLGHAAERTSPIVKYVTPELIVGGSVARVSSPS